MNQAITITGFVLQKLQAVEERLGSTFRITSTSPFGIRWSPNHDEWFYLIKRSGKISIWRKGNSLVSKLFPLRYLYFSIENDNNDTLAPINQSYTNQ